MNTLPNFLSDRVVVDDGMAFLKPFACEQPLHGSSFLLSVIPIFAAVSFEAALHFRDRTRRGAR